MIIFDNLNWLIYGAMIGLFVPITLLIGNKQFGISSSLQNLCALVIPKSKGIFSSKELSKNSWKLYFAIGIVLGGFIASNFFSRQNTIYLPDEYYTVDGIIILFVGGLLVGFGTRYANGCTSGHSITGLSLLKLSSLIATISFFIGGLIYTYL